VPTIRNQHCQTTTSHAANQFSNDLQWDPDPFSLQGKLKIMDFVDVMALSFDDLSGLKSAQLEKRACDLTGHCNTLTLWMRKMFWVCLTVYGRALSCWKIPT
jgi:hypothetical protein